MPNGDNWFDDVRDVQPPQRAPMGLYGPEGLFVHEEPEHGHKQGAWSKTFEALLAIAVCCGLAALLAKANVFEPSGYNQIGGSLLVLLGFLGILCVSFAGCHWVRWMHAGFFASGMYVVFWFVFHHDLVH